MIIHNPILTGSFTVNGTDVASITSSAASITALNSYTASQNILNGTYTLTSSFAAQTASFTAFTSSVNSFTASQLVLNGTYATTGSNTFAGIQTVNSNLVVTGSITAQTLVVQTITSSVDFVTGSTRFGSSLSTSTHQFTGSVSITGSLSGTSATFSGNVGVGGATISSMTAVSGIELVQGSQIASRILVNVPQLYISSNVAGDSYAPTYKVNGYATQYRLQGYDGTHVFYTAPSGTAGNNVNFTASLTITPTGNVGIGTSSPSEKLHLYNNTAATSTSLIIENNINNYNCQINFKSIYGGSTAKSFLIGSNISVAAGSWEIYDATAAAARLVISSGGNVGIGGTPVTLDSGGVNLQIKDRSALFQLAAVNSTYLSNNIYYDGSWKRIVSGFGALIRLNDDSNGFSFLTTGTGGANSAVTFTSAMNITNAGNVEIGNASRNSFSYLSLINDANTNGGVIAIARSAGQFLTAAGAGDMIIGNSTGENILFGNGQTGTTEYMRITSAGYLFINTTTNSGFSTSNRIKGPSSTEGTDIISLDGGIEFSGLFRAVSGAAYSGVQTAIIIGKNSSTNRSINAGGTINASGTDYAEYMTKAIEDTIAKGDIVGVNSNGLLTNVFADSISFVIKSTDPSYVGGDTWGSVDIIGKLDPEASEEEKTEYNTKLEEAKAKVDRIAFSGQVPCNVTGSNVGDYIIPIQLENGKIGGQAISNPTFEQFKSAVGKVWNIMNDGRAWIKVIN